MGQCFPFRMIIWTLWSTSEPKIVHETFGVHSRCTSQNLALKKASKMPKGSCTRVFPGSSVTCLDYNQCDPGLVEVSAKSDG